MAQKFRENKEFIPYFLNSDGDTPTLAIIIFCGEDRTRTYDFLLAKQTL